MSYAGIVPAGDRDGLKGPFAQNGEPPDRATIFFVQNDTKIGSESIGKPDNEKAKEKTSGKEKNDARKTKQLKPFVPSETIPADQGVDFPYDI